MVETIVRRGLSPLQATRFVTGFSPATIRLLWPTPFFAFAAGPTVP